MAGSCLCCSFCQNLPGTGRDKSAGGTQKPPPANGSGFPLPAPPLTDSRVSTPTASCTPILAPAPVPALAKYTNADFHQFMKVFMDAQGRSKTHKGPQKSFLKARFPNLYYGKSHMDCYQFCQQCENHFETASTTGPNRVLFAALFLCRPINFR